MLGVTLPAKEYLDRVRAEIGRLDLKEVEALSELIERAYHEGRFVFVIGNGVRAGRVRPLQPAPAPNPPTRALAATGATTS